MKLIEYKRNRNEELELVGEQDVRKVRMIHAYEGKFEYINQINGGLSLYFIKNEDARLFENGKNDITVYSVRMNECYIGRNNVSLSHVILSHANGMFIDDMENILEKFSSNEYSIITPTNLGQFFTYDAGEKGIDYTKTEIKKDGLSELTIIFLNEEKRKPFIYELHDLISIDDVLDEIRALTISKDVKFVHHENGVGYASPNMKKLKDISGYVYQNYLIEDAY